jgi:iron(III) transport system ATP-binding protein
MSSVVLRGVSRSFGEVRAVRELDLEVAAGGRLAIVGPSASGKTTVLRLIAGFEAPDRGTISIGDTLVAGDGVLMPAHRRRVGYVPQDGALFPHLTVGANVGFGLQRSPDRAERVAELLRLVALDPSLSRRRPDQLSGGQQQRVALARALAVRPVVMLLDEPFSALDAELRVETRDGVTRLLDDAGITAILVTHDPDDAAAFAPVSMTLREGLRVG